jgi:predicted ferric reductase
MTAQLSWHVARVGGIVAWALVTASVVWGLLLSTGVAGRRLRANWLADLHRFLGGLAVVFTAVHVVALLFDRFVPFSVIQVLVPFTASWKPTAIALGVVAMWLLLAVEVTSLLRHRLSKRAWRGVHLGSFALFWAASLHGALAGTDAAGAWFRVGSVAAVAGVLFLVLVRLLLTKQRTAQARPTLSRAPASGPRQPPRIGISPESA